jgi:DNA-binding FadR family transcriptional regulator
MSQDLLSDSILRYIMDEELFAQDREPAKLPSLGKLARELGVSRGKLREDLIAAQACGMVEMRPGDGTYVRAFDFYAAIRPAVLYGIACDKRNFDRFYRLRARIEIAFWEEAVEALEQEDLDRLARVLQRAERRLQGTPVEIPHREHRDFHLRIFDKLGNPFVQGLLKVYWDAYEAVGLHRYFELSYYRRMWSSHREMVQAIVSGRHQEGRQVLAQHFTLLESRLQGEGTA